MRKNLLVSLAVSLLFLATANGQNKLDEQRCADVPGETSATHAFRRSGETIEIAIRGDGVPASVVDCEPLSLELRWSNGRNNGSNFNVTFLDDYDKPIYSRGISAFLSGVLELQLSSFDVRPAYGSSLALVSVPSRVTIEATSPFAAPAVLSYNVVRVRRPAKQRAIAGDEARRGNEIIGIHNALRLIGASRLPVVQMELKTSRPFPVKDVPLQLQIGKRVFSEELSGDHTGRKLTLSLTPEMFAELQEGDEIVAFFGKSNESLSAAGEVWNFGKLTKNLKPAQ